MKEFIDLLRETYKTRDKALSDKLLKWIDDDCINIGTSLGEVSRSKAEFDDLIKSDLKYWVDIDIKDDYAEEKVGDYVIYTLKADALCKFKVDDKCYGRYVGYMNDIQAEGISEYAKAVKAIWELDHLIASRKGVRRIDAKPIKITLLAKDEKIKVVMFEHQNLTKNHIDCISGTQSDMDEDFASDMACFKSDEKLAALIKDTQKIDGLRIADISVVRVGDVFAGCSTLINDSPIDDEIKRDFEALSEDGSSYQKLYNLRKRLGETLRLYSYSDKQLVMARFFGVLRDGAVACLKHSYPFYWILEG